MALDSILNQTNDPSIQEGWRYIGLFLLGAGAGALIERWRQSRRSRVWTTRHRDEIFNKGEETDETFNKGEETVYEKSTLADSLDNPDRDVLVYATPLSLELTDRGYAGRFSDDSATLPYYIDFDTAPSYEEEGLIAVLLRDAMERQKPIEFCGSFDHESLVFIVDSLKYLMDKIPYEIQPN